MSTGKTIVVDASAAVAVLNTEQPAADWVADVLRGATLAAPRLMPFEAANILRRLQLVGVLDRSAATTAYHELLETAVKLWPQRPLASRAWELRDNTTYYDACYVALAEMLDAPLVTLDRRLARASGPRCAFLVPPPE